MPEKTKLIVKRVLLWCAVALWMAVIFSFSAENADKSTETSGSVVERVLGVLLSGKKETVTDETLAAFRETLTVIVRKSAHFTAYLILGALFSCALDASGATPRTSRALSLVFSTLYAVSDEVHQLFVPGRSGRVPDVLIDAAGALTGILLAAFFARAAAFIKEKRRKIYPPQEIINE